MKRRKKEFVIFKYRWKVKELEVIVREIGCYDLWWERNFLISEKIEIFFFEDLKDNIDVYI